MRLYFIVLLLIASVVSAASVPGTGITIAQLSDDFEDVTWSFDYVNNISSNGKWYGEYRGAPDIVERTGSPAGGIYGQTGSLRLREKSNQGDLVTKAHSILYGRLLVRSDMPNIIAHIYLPPYSEMQKNYSTLGFRMEARSNQLIGQNNPVGWYYPSIWLQYFDNNFGVIVRMGDGLSTDQYIKNMGSNYPGGWVTVGISFDAAGVGHYYFKEGVSAFTAADKIYDTTQFPGGSNAKMDSIAYNFFSVGGTSSDTIYGADYRIEDVFVYQDQCAYKLAQGIKNRSDFNNDCRVDFYDFAVLAKQWLVER